MLRFPRVLWAVVLLAVGLALPALFADLYSDDQGMVLSLEGVAPPPIPGPFHLYTFMSGARGERDTMVAESEIPWWSADGIRIAFCRPLSSALLAVDYALVGRKPIFYHLHSMAWYAAAALAAALLFRRVLPEREAALAALLFAVSPAHWMLAAWPSSRHVAISGAFAIVALLLHLEARERDSRWLLAGALASAALALSGGETALGLFGLIAAYELLGRPGTLSQRLRALLPWGALFLGYALQYRALGYGVRGVGAYVDPIQQPAAYLSLLPSRFAVYLGAALLCLPSEISVVAPQAVPLLAAVGVAAGLGFAGPLRKALRAAEPDTRRTLAWLALGGCLAVLPGIASIPGDRVLFLSNLAVAPAVALVLLRGWAKGTRAVFTVLARVAVGFFALVHGLLAPLSFAYGASTLASTSHTALAAVAHAEIPARPGVEVAGIGLSDPLVGMYLPAAVFIAPRSEPRPSAVYLLSMSAHDHLVTRVADRTLEISVVGGTLLEGALEYLFRPASAPLHVGDTLPLGPWQVRILAEAGGKPSRFSVELERSVDDPNIVLLIWKNGALRALTPPKIGQQVLVRHELGPMGI